MKIVLDQPFKRANPATPIAPKETATGTPKAIKVNEMQKPKSPTIGSDILICRLRRGDQTRKAAYNG